jgi:hypothetical protein
MPLQRVEHAPSGISTIPAAVETTVSRPNGLHGADMNSAKEIYHCQRSIFACHEAALGELIAVPEMQSCAPRPVTDCDGYGFPRCHRRGLRSREGLEIMGH